MKTQLALIAAFVFALGLLAAYAAPRTLTADERAVLGYVVADPDGWWTNVQASGMDPERALQAKLLRWGPAYRNAAAAGHAATRADRDAIAEASRPKPPKRARALTARELANVLIAKGVIGAQDVRP